MLWFGLKCLHHAHDVLMIKIKTCFTLVFLGKSSALLTQLQALASSLQMFVHLQWQKKKLGTLLSPPQ